MSSITTQIATPSTMSLISSSPQRSMLASHRRAQSSALTPERTGKNIKQDVSLSSPAYMYTPSVDETISRSGPKRKSDEHFRSGRGSTEGVSSVGHPLSNNVTPRSEARRARAGGAISTGRSPDARPPLVSSMTTPEVHKYVEPLVDQDWLQRGETSWDRRRCSLESQDAEKSPSLLYRPIFARTDTSISTPPAQSSTKFFRADEIQPKKTSSRPTSIVQAPKAWIASSQHDQRKDIPGPICGISMPFSSGSSVQCTYAPINTLQQTQNVAYKNTSRTSSANPAKVEAFASVRPQSPLKDSITLSEISPPCSSPITDRTSHGSSIQSCAGRIPDDHISKRQSGGSIKQATSYFPSQSVASKNHMSEEQPSQTGFRAQIHDTSQCSSAICKSPRIQTQSPTRANSTLDQLHEMALSARRDRKVLDLEISNSSLLAINQALERELRKQKHEIRRFRRLDQAGRFSSLSNSIRSSRPRATLRRDPDSTLSESSLDSTEEIDEEDDEGGNISCDDDDDCRSSSSSSSNSQNLHPDSSAARTRFKDMHIQPLDMTAFQSLIKERQNLSRSIQRSLEHSENMLSMARSALAMDVYDCERESPGARVLGPEEIDDSVFIRGHGLLSPTATDSSRVRPWDLVPSPRHSDIACQDQQSDSSEKVYEVKSTDALESQAYSIDDESDEMLKAKSHSEYALTSNPNAHQERLGANADLAGVVGNVRIRQEDTTQSVSSAIQSPVTQTKRNSVQNFGHYLSNLALFNNRENGAL